MVAAWGGSSLNAMLTAPLIVIRALAYLMVVYALYKAAK